jgi:7-cyano-7-deazaguanine synthase in queuosine biosynthesis
MLMFIEYGQNKQESVAAAKLAMALTIRFPSRTVDYFSVKFPQIISAATPDGIIHNRNVLFCSLAAVYAAKYGVPSIALGFTAPVEKEGLPTLEFTDTSPEFVLTMNGLFSLPDGRVIAVTAPLIQTTKDEIYAELFEAELLTKTWSCYSLDSKEPCGECHACRMRLAYNANVVDLA